MPDFLHPDQIIKSRYPFCAHNLSGCGVYFWIDRGQIVYVGQSQDLNCRYNGPSYVHCWPQSFYFITEEDQAQRKAIEALYIHWSQPPMNKTYPRCFTPEVRQFIESEGITLHKGKRDKYVRFSLHPLHGVLRIEEKPFRTEEDLFNAIQNLPGF